MPARSSVTGCIYIHIRTLNFWDFFFFFLRFFFHKFVFFGAFFFFFFGLLHLTQTIGENWPLRLHCNLTDQQLNTQHQYCDVHTGSCSTTYLPSSILINCTQQDILDVAKRCCRSSYKVVTWRVSDKLALPCEFKLRRKGNPLWILLCSP